MGYVNGSNAIVNFIDVSTGGVGNATFGNFSISGILAGDTDPGSLITTSVDTKLTAGAPNPASLTVYATITDVTAPLGKATYLSGFASNTLPAGWKVAESTYYDPGDVAYSTANVLDPGLTWTTTGGTNSTDLTSVLSGPYSLTVKYVITAVSGARNQSANSSINVTAVTTPLPGALPLFVSGLSALGFVGWRKRRTAKRAA